MSFISDFFGEGDIIDIVAGGQADVADLFGRQGAAAAREAAERQEDAFGAGIGEQRRQFDEIIGLLGPSLEAGDLARQQQLALLGLLGPEAQEAAQTQFAESPGQQFIRERQQRALTRNASAIGGLGGGNIRTALQQQAAGFASQDISNQFNRLQGLSAPGTNVAISQGQFGQNAANSISELLARQGGAGASGILGGQQAQAQGGQNVASLAAAFFSDSRLKDNIKKIGEIGVLNVYEWDWKTTGLADVGFLAEDVRVHFPELVTEHNGFLAVNYDLAIQEAA